METFQKDILLCNKVQLEALGMRVSKMGKRIWNGQMLFGIKDMVFWEKPWTGCQKTWFY